MIHNIFKTLFVFAILLGFVPTAHALTLEEYWNDESHWNIRTDKETSGETILSNIDCSDEEYSKTTCCTLLAANLKTSDVSKRLYIQAHYAHGTTDFTATQPTQCTYKPNDCSYCFLNTSDTQITGQCIYYWADSPDTVEQCNALPDSPATCVDPTEESETTINGITVSIPKYDTEHSCYCSLGRTLQQDGTCSCPDNAICDTPGDPICNDGFYTTVSYTTLTCTQCPAGSYCPEGDTTGTPTPCPAGSYCPAGSSTHKKCPTAWKNSSAGSDAMTDCYADLGENLGAAPNATPHTEFQYINCPNGQINETTASQCSIKSTSNIADTTANINLRGYSYPTGKIYYPNTGIKTCPYKDENKDNADNIMKWLGGPCPLADQDQTDSITNITIVPSYRIGTKCNAEVTIDTNCGKIHKEVIPLDEDTTKYLTYKNNAEVNSHFYHTLVAGLYATDLISENYCSAGSTKKQYYRTAHICPAGKYCEGFPDGARNCPNDGTNPNEFPPTGDVAGGYYSTGGAKTPTPTGTGNGCLTGFNCGKTAEGYYSSGGGTTNKPTAPNNGCLTGYECGKCDVGQSCAAGSTSPINCTAGYYCQNGKEIACDAGYYCPAGSSEQTTCPAGYYCPAGSQAGDTNKCPAGYYCPAGSQAGDTNKCPAGSTSDAGQSAITDCYIKGGDDGTGFCVNNKCFNIQTNVFYKQPSN